MKQAFPFLLLAAGVGLTIWLWMAYRRFTERGREAEERLATQMVQAMTAAKPKPSAVAGLKPAAEAKPVAEVKPAGDPASVAQQKLLFEAAFKAGEAGESVLSIQLYARLIARYPDSAFAAQARAAAEAQKKKLLVKS
jgi:TolA-binding protein